MSPFSLAEKCKQTEPRVFTHFRMHDSKPSENFLRLSPPDCVVLESLAITVKSWVCFPTETIEFIYQMPRSISSKLFVIASGESNVYGSSYYWNFRTSSFKQVAYLMLNLVRSTYFWNKRHQILSTSSDTLNVIRYSQRHMILSTSSDTLNVIRYSQRQNTGKPNNGKNVREQENQRV